MSDPLILSEAIRQFFIAKQAERLSPSTFADYGNTFKQFRKYIGDPYIQDITPAHVREFLASLTHLAKKTVVNYWTGLSSLWTWAYNDGIVSDHVMRKVKKPRTDRKAVKPFSDDDIQKIFSCKHKKYPLRNKAILYILLDTGIRCSELCDAQVEDYKGRTLTVWGKGDKERIVPLSALTMNAIDDYLQHERPDPNEGNPLIVSDRGEQFTRSGIYQMLYKMGPRTGVRKIYTHRFRHTFAVSFLRNGGDVFSLQEILGHTTLEMTRRYVKLARLDIQKTHERASPITCLHLS
ncbi:MAG: tyrosine-type recombinase/integrase [Anaerolineales bacterium]|jgi:site-specific recombinase XerD